MREWSGKEGTTCETTEETARVVRVSLIPNGWAKRRISMTNTCIPMVTVELTKGARPSCFV